ncbi:hypothetical protein COV12_03140 [Candidatus Woesearchaeota archaeon CG10_big_fil_rev_8_21_14_0_10_32_24]|nr:MAG: hypothetical protein COV12_03140 [Candidatus Woesearchaeota archaeon CG10_big_fil_rev_8_21_14_0_10_32_24]
MEFNGSHVSQIVTGKGWKEKLEWINQNYETLLKPMEFNGYHVSQIVRNKGWEEKLEWIAQNYVFFKEKGLSNYKLASYFNTKDWHFKTRLLSESVDLFDNIVIDDERLSPLLEPYLRNLIFESESKEATEIISSLIQKCTIHQNLVDFENNVYSISGLKTTNLVDEVLFELNNKFEYSAEEVKMYLVAMNKNNRGLLSWYNSGEKTKPYTLSLDQESAWDNRTLLEKIPTEDISPLESIERDQLINQVYKSMSEAHPGHKDIWHKLIFDYGCDVENLSIEEIKDFNCALRDLRNNKSLLGDIYNILKT